MSVTRRAAWTSESCRSARARPAGLAALVLAALLAGPPAALGQSVEIRVTNGFSRSPQILRDEYSCKPSPCVSTPPEAIGYGQTGEGAVASSSNLAMATVFYKATVNHKAYGCRFSLTVTKTRGSCDVAQILISPYLTQDGNSPRCAILEPGVPVYPDCRLVVTFGMGN